MRMSKSPRFWRNVTLIALAHLALIAGLIRWSLAARSAPEAESLVWLSGAEGLLAEKSESSSSSAKTSAPSVESEPLEPDETEKERPSLSQAKSEIDLSTPKATPVATPKAFEAPRPKPTPKPAPKPTPKPTPKKTVLAKATKSSAHPKSTPQKSTGEQTDASNEKKKSTKTKSSADNGAGKTGSAGKGGGAGGGSNASEFGWYGNMLHDRFYSAWIQPTTTVATGTKISTLVKVRIERDGRVSKFELIKPSENPVVNESVAAVAKHVSQVDPPPTGLIKGDHYDVKINFELNTDAGSGDR